MRLRITVLPGDGIGPEVTAEAVKVLQAVAGMFDHELELGYWKIGAEALALYENPLPEDTIEACLESDAVLLGAVGSPAYDNVPMELRPEAGLLRLRQSLGAFANLRPATLFPSLIDSSPLKPEIVQGTDMMIVRELLGGLYFGEPKGVEPATGNGFRVGINTMRYTEPEIERVARVAFDLARRRKGRLTSVDKANVLDCSRLWRETVTRVGEDYPDIRLEHLYVDACAAVLVEKPTRFDVMLTENTFGDILSDQAGAIVGSIGLLSSASIGGRGGLYEPVHGSAPDIAGRGLANPLGSILSAALMLRHSFDLGTEAARIEDAVARALESGARTADLVSAGEVAMSTTEMGERVIENLAASLAGSSEA